MVAQKPSAGTVSGSKNKAFTPSKYPRSRRDIEALNLSMEAQLVLWHLMDISNRHGQSFPSNKEIAESCFRNGKRKDYQIETLERMLKFAINELVEAGILLVYHRKRDDGSNYTNLYQLVPMADWPPITEEQIERLPWPIARRARRRLGQVAQAVEQATKTIKNAVKEVLNNSVYKSIDRGGSHDRGGGYATAPHNFIISNLDLREENNKADFESNPRGEVFEFEWGEEVACTQTFEAKLSRQEEPDPGINGEEVFEVSLETQALADFFAGRSDTWEPKAQTTLPVNSSALPDPESKPEENHKSEPYTPVISSQTPKHFAQELLHNAGEQDRARGFSASKENKPKPKPRQRRNFVQSDKPMPVLRVPGFRPRYIGEVLRDLPIIKNYVMLPRERLYTLPRFIAVRLCQYWLIEKIIGYPPFAESEDGCLIYDGRQVMLDLEEAMADYDIEFGPEDDILAPDCPLTLRLLRNWAVSHKKTTKDKFNQMLTGFFIKAQEFLKQGGSYFEFLQKPLLILPGLAD